MSSSGAEPAALEIEVIVDEGVDPGVGSDELTSAAAATLEKLGVTEGHVAIEIVGEDRIHGLNMDHRDKDKPTDVLSFPVDGVEIATDGPPSPADGPIELGDVVICPPHTEDMVEATVHGVLHLCGYDHETDEGEMLKIQDEIVDALRAAQ